MNLSLAALALAAWGLLQGRPRDRAGTLLGALLLGLAAATLALVSRDSGSLIPDNSFGTTAVWHGVGGLVIVAVSLACLACPRPITFGLAAAVAWRAWPLLTLAPVSRTIGAAAAVLAAGALGGAMVRLLRPGRILRGADRLLDPAGRAAWRPAADWVPTAWLLVATVGTVAALAIPHLAIVLGGSLVALAAGWIASLRAGRNAWALVPLLPVVAFVLLWSLHLSGPLGGWIPQLIDGPFSPRAARLLGLLAGATVIGAAGLWPLHGVTVPVLLAPVAIAVGGVFAVALVPDGVQWWQPLAAPLALLATGHAVAARRPASCCVSIGVFGLWTGTPMGALGGAVLILSGWLLVVAPISWPGRLPWSPAVLRAAWIGPATGILAVLHAGMRGEVAWSLALAGVLATALVGFARPAAAVDPGR